MLKYLNEVRFSEGDSEQSIKVWWSLVSILSVCILLAYWGSGQVTANTDDFYCYWYYFHNASALSD